MKITCTNCGASVPIEERTTVVICPWCQASLFAELTEGIPQCVFKRTVAEGAEMRQLKAFLERHEITETPEHVSSTIQYYPFWRFTTRAGKHNYLVAACTPPADALLHFPEPSGETESPEVLETSHIPTVAPETLVEETHAQTRVLDIPVHVEKDTLALVYLPILIMRYRLHRGEYHAVLNLSDGHCAADTLPPSPQRQKSRTLALVTVVAFLYFLLISYRLPVGALAVVMPVSMLVMYAGMRWLLKRKGW